MSGEKVNRVQEIRSYFFSLSFPWRKQLERERRTERTISCPWRLTFQPLSAWGAMRLVCWPLLSAHKKGEKKRSIDGWCHHKWSIVTSFLLFLVAANRESSNNLAWSGPKSGTIKVLSNSWRSCVHARRRFSLSFKKREKRKKRSLLKSTWSFHFSFFFLFL